MVNLIPEKLKFGTLKSKFRKEVFDGIGITILLILICIIMISNIVRVAQKGISNYNVYIYEKNQLQKEQQKNEELQDEFDYYSSGETKELLARDVLDLGKAGESLYTTGDDVKFYQEEKKLLVVEDKSLISWWTSLIKL